jgi:hypothetical protein
MCASDDCSLSLLVSNEYFSSLSLHSLTYTQAIRVFFLLRDLSLVLRGEEETQLPLTHGEADVRIDQLLDLSK